MPLSRPSRGPGNPILVLGAGATKACNGPLTNEILFDAGQAVSSIEREGYLSALDCFLEAVFHMPARPVRTKLAYPGLPLLMSLIDTAIDRNQPLHSDYDVDRLREVRAAIEYAIFAVLEYKLRGTIPPLHSRANALLFPEGVEPQIISLNYDIIVDNMLAALPAQAFPDYGCDIQTDTYRNWGKFGKLFKLHGSLNWMYCPNCNRLDVAVSRSGGGFSKALDQLFMAEGEANDLEHRYSCHGSPCRTCGTFVRPVMITPTQRKDYRNPHIARVWYQAEEALRKAGSVVFIGYSMPPDDVEVVYLFKRGLENLPADRITVVEFDERHRPASEHEVGQRYQSVFGAGIQWHTCGFEGWLQERSNGVATCAGR
jgi:hypothetical protein